jgi:hypothetical protein
MIMGILAAAALHAVPRDAAVQRHIACVRTEERQPDGPGDVREGLAPEATPLPMIVGFARVIEFCHREREQAIVALRASARLRHSDWKEEEVNRGAELALSRLELELVSAGLAPVMTSHGPIDDF